MSKGASDYLHSNIALRMFLVRTLVAIDRECARQGRMISFECPTVRHRFCIYAISDRLWLVYGPIRVLGHVLPEG